MKKAICLAAVLSMFAGLLTGCSSNDVQASPDTGREAEYGSETENTGSVSTNFDGSKPINVISREDGSGTRGAFIELFEVEVKDADGNKKDMTTKEAVIVNKTDVMMTSIAGDTYGIGYISLGSLNSSVKALEIDGAAATVENIKSGIYKISRPFNIATKGEISEAASDFIDYIMSAEGQAVISNDGYIAVDDSAPAYSGSASGKIVVAGSSSVTPVMEKLAEAYQVLNPGADIEIQMSDSSAGMTGATDGTCDIGMASRDLKDSELEQLIPTVIAMDGIAVIVHNDNENDDLSSEQVRGIFTGEITIWNDVK